MLKILIKKQLLELFQSYFVDKKSGKARSRAGSIGFFVLFALLFLCLGFTFYSMASGIGAAVLGNGINWLYFALVGLISIALGVFGSVFNTYAAVYLPKDNELLKSLPIPSGTLLLARLAGLYVTSAMYSALVWIPGMIAYWVIVPVNALNVVFPILMIFVIALFVSVLSCILGWLVALIAVKVKGKSIITLLLSLTVLALYYVVYFRIIGSLGEIVSHVGEIGNTVKSWLHYSYLLGRASDGDAVSMLLVAVITLVLAGLCFLVLSKTFSKLSAAGTGSKKKTKADASYPVKPVRRALLMREYKHFTSLTTWMLNGGLGLLLMIAAAVVLIVKSRGANDVAAMFAANAPELGQAFPVMLTAAVCLILSTSPILPVAVSMEGKTLWQIESLPVDAWEILRAKELMGVELSVLPTLILAVTGCIIFGFNPWITLLVCAAVLVYVWLISDFGLFLNLKMPNFSWSDEAHLTKQSMPVVISMFGGWGFCVALGAGGYFLSKAAGIWVALGAIIVLLLALEIILHTWLKKKGTIIFASL